MSNLQNTNKIQIEFRMFNSKHSRQRVQNLFVFKW